MQELKKKKRLFETKRKETKLKSLNIIGAIDRIIRSKWLNCTP